MKQRRTALGLVGALSAMLMSASLPSTQAQDTTTRVYWTVKLDGISATGAGSVAMHITGPGHSPEPADSTWAGCDSGFIWFHRAWDNSKVYDDDQKNRMLSVATSAYLANKSVRVAIERDASRRCYTSFVTMMDE